MERPVFDLIDDNALSDKNLGRGQLQQPSVSRSSSQLSSGSSYHTRSSKTAYFLKRRRIQLAFKAEKVRRRCSSLSIGKGSATARLLWI